jgi:hypothetical protein
MTAEEFLKEANSVLNELGESRKRADSLSEENKELKKDLIEKFNVISELKKRIVEIGQAGADRKILSDENAILKRKLVEKLRLIDNSSKHTEDINQLKMEKFEVISHNNQLKKEIDENKELADRFIKKLRELSLDKGDFNAIKQENSLLKSKLSEKFVQVEKLSEKIDMLTRTLVKSDKFMQELKASHDTKQKEAEFLTKQIQFLTSDQKARLSDFKKNLEEDARVINFLKSKVSELAPLQKIKEEKSVESTMKEGEIGKLSALVNQFRGKMLSLEEINKKLMRENQELEFKLKGLENERRKIMVPEAKNVSVNASVEKMVSREIDDRLKNPRVKIAGFSIDDLETNEIRAVIRTALSHGDSLEKIKNSLLSSGYKKEKIERCLVAFHNNSF